MRSNACGIRTTPILGDFMKRHAKKAGDAKHPRLYHFDDDTIAHIEHLGGVFGGKEKAIAAAIGIVSNLLRGETADLRISGKTR
jgi:hypothetical protein